MLLVTIFLMGFASMAIGLIPTYAQIGLIAPLLLLLLRVLQGLSAGGEFTGAQTYIVEMAPPKKRGYTDPSLHWESASVSLRAH